MPVLPTTVSPAGEAEAVGVLKVANNQPAKRQILMLASAEANHSGFHLIRISIPEPCSPLAVIIQLLLRLINPALRQSGYLNTVRYSFGHTASSD